MDEAEKKKVQEEIEAKKKELATLKARLNELNVQKESWFEKKRAATREISDLSRNLRDSKGKRDQYTKQVKDSKSRRQALNTELRQKLAEMKKLQQEKRDIAQKFSIRGDPSRIRQEIEELELRIETEALPFRIEQQIMKRIAERKKVLEQARQVSDVFERSHALQKEIDKIRQKADDTHRKVQNKADASQKFHEELVDSSKDMKDLRTKEEDALKKFVELKQQWNQQNDLVRAKMDEI
ncbi:hypothetical protein KY362_05405, partial [Candidatus Woesearchaeota archaeon]|nr:hypothetical protein [Candidatus Woesearchaeota archaeon]